MLAVDQSVLRRGLCWLVLGSVLGCGPEPPADLGALTQAASYPGAQFITTDIRVCNNPARPVPSDVLQIVRNAVTTEYERKTRLRFTGWDTSCGRGTPSSVLLTYDTTCAVLSATTPPSCSGLGCAPSAELVLSILSTRKCPLGSPGPTLLTPLIEFTAVHEFGHALGLRHEDERADVPLFLTHEGTDPSATSDHPFSEINAGPYDAQSVMNNAGAKVGVLSSLDVLGINTRYGWPGLFATSGSDTFRYDTSRSPLQRCTVTSATQLAAFGGPGMPVPVVSTLPLWFTPYVDTGACAWPPGLYTSGVSTRFFPDASGPSCTIADAVQLAGYGGNARNVGGASLNVGRTTGLGEPCAGGYPARRPIFRLWSNNTGEHLYTKSSAELQAAVRSGGWVHESYGFALEVQHNNGRVALFRCQTPTRRFLTTSATCEGVAATIENIVGYLWPTATTGTVPLYRVYSPTLDDHLYTTSVAERAAALAYYGYTAEGITGYVYADIGTTDPLYWSSAGSLPGKSCLLVNEPADAHSWGDNYLCGDHPLPLKWSRAGPTVTLTTTGAYVADTCTSASEPTDPDGWYDNYFCTASQAGFQLSWSSSGPLAGRPCVKIGESADPHTWDDNYLCWN